MRSKGYTINGEFFKTKDAILKRVREILYTYPIGTQVSSGDCALLLELLHNHPNATEKIGCGIEAFEIRQENSISRCFYLIRTDGSDENFSYKKLVGAPTKLAVFKSVCRALVFRQILRIKSNHFREHAREDGRVQCPITRKWIMQEEAHVDHAPPNTFIRLVTDFIAQHNIDVEQIEIQDADKDINKTFADGTLVEGWVEYHQMKADLRVVSAFANLTIIPRREQALNRLSKHYDLSLVYELEPERTETLVDLALDCTYVEWREEDFALLKMYASRLVGSEAVRAELRAERYEVALHAFLDWLLEGTAVAMEETA